MANFWARRYCVSRSFIFFDCSRMYKMQYPWQQDWQSPGFSVYGKTLTPLPKLRVPPPGGVRWATPGAH